MIFYNKIIDFEKEVITMHNPPVLSPRLTTVAELIPRCGCFADIGTDHAYLPVYLCMNKVCDFAIASDVNKGPLMRAKKTVSDFGMEEHISLRLGSGFETLSIGEADAVSVAGMGGLIIAKILEEGRERIKQSCKVVLQPMTAVSELREYLYKNNWIIEREALAKEESKMYNIIVVSRGGSENITPTAAELYIGKYLIEHKVEHLEEYLNKKITKLKKMIAGLEISDTEESKKKLEECRALLVGIEKLK